MLKGTNPTVILDISADTLVDQLIPIHNEVSVLLSIPGALPALSCARVYDPDTPHYRGIVKDCTGNGTITVII